MPDDFAALPGWHTWKSVSGLFCARRLWASSPIWSRARNATDLADQITRARRVLAAGLRL